MGLFETSERLRASPLLAWTVAVFLCASAIAIRFAIDPYLPPGFQYLTFFPAVILASFFCGLQQGIATCIVSGIAAWYWFIAPFDSFVLNAPTAVALVFYFIVAGVDIALIHFVLISVERLEQERGTNRELYDQQRTMFQELQHRVANNMQFVASLLAIQKRKVAKDPSLADEYFEEARERLVTISRIHRRLYDPETVHLPIDQYLDELARDVLGSGGNIPVQATVQAPNACFDLRELTNLSLLIVEALTNAQKHAFTGRAEGHIAISLEDLGQNRHRLTVADDGVGFDPDTDPMSSHSLGQKIMQSLAAQLNGSVSYEQDVGTRMTVEFFAQSHRTKPTNSAPPAIPASADHKAPPYEEFNRAVQ